MYVPDCLGLDLYKASHLLESCGASFDVRNALPFFKGAPKEPPLGTLFVIGQSEENGIVVLTVCAVPPEGDEHVR